MGIPSLGFRTILHASKHWLHPMQDLVMTVECADWVVNAGQARGPIAANAIRYIGSIGVLDRLIWPRYHVGEDNCENIAAKRNS
jgi:hypothetical protein